MGWLEDITGGAGPGPLAALGGGPVLLATAVLGAAAAFWCAVGLASALGFRRLPRLGVARPLADADLPPLAIVAAAKDEGPGVASAARSLLGQDYPNLRVLIVEDRSSDETGAILDRLAESEARLRVIHVRALPEGWIGKCHALARGAEAAEAEWILFTDGDVTFAPDAARRAVSLALSERCDHLTVGPDMRVEGLGEAIFVGFFTVLFNATQKPWRASDPRRRDSVGIGAFNLVRAGAYHRSGGYERLRYELVDDLGLGRILKDAGARQAFARHDGLVSVRWHHGVWGLIRGVEKNAFPAARYDVRLTVLGSIALLALCAAPALGMFAPGPVARSFALLAWAGVFLAYWAASRAIRIRVWHAIFMPVGAALFVFALLRSMGLTLARGGVLWRGTFYPLAELRRGRVR